MPTCVGVSLTYPEPMRNVFDVRQRIVQRVLYVGIRSLKRYSVTATLNRNLPKNFNQFSKSKKGDNSVNMVERVMGIVSDDGDVDS